MVRQDNMTPGRAVEAAGDARIEAILNAVLKLVRTQPAYRALWRIIRTHDWQERLLADCLRRVDGMRGAGPAQAQPFDVASLDRLIVRCVQDSIINCIENRVKSQPGPSIALIVPTRAFATNFGGVAEELRAIGCHVMRFYGYAEALGNRYGLDDFVLFDDMIRTVRGVDAMIVTTVMDCLPDDTKKILLEHASFASFGLDHNVDAVRNGNIAGDPSASTERMFETFSAYVSYFPLIDLHFAPSRHFAQTVDDVAHALGYRAVGEDAQPVSKNAKSIWKFLGDKAIPDVSTVVLGGYPKLDAVVERAGEAQAENVIVYAPTPAPDDNSGNKSGSEWADFVSLDKYGADVIRRLCSEFPDHRIVFKPYVGDSEDTVDRVSLAGSEYDNFELSLVGSDYWDLFLKTKVLVSDFSSTAYTFAFGVGRPVAFFSPNERRLGARAENAYCRHRLDVGEIACDLDELCSTVRALVDDHGSYCRRVDTFRNGHSFNIGRASRQIAQDIGTFLGGETGPDWKRYRPPPVRCRTGRQRSSAGVAVDGNELERIRLRIAKRDSLTRKRIPNLLFCNLFYSGASAIVPILEHTLPDLGVNVTDYGPEGTDTLIGDPPKEPYFHWTHHPPEFFESLFQEEKIRVVFLHRDPRDVAVSYCADHILNGSLPPEREQELLRRMPLMSQAENFRAACRWVELAKDRSIKVVSFDELKEDTVAVILDVMAFYGVEVDGELRRYIQAIYDTKYSYEAMTGRRRGEDGETVRARYMARKGVSGEWREKFDNETKAIWLHHLADQIEFLGYAA